MTKLLTIRPIELNETGRVSVEDYDVLAAWWNDRGGNAPDRAMLPQCGSMAEYNGSPVAAMFMYLDGCSSGVAWLGFLATNPDCNDFIRGKALKLLVEDLSSTAKELDYWLLVGHYQNESLIRLLCNSGFRVGDKGMTQLLKEL